MRFNDLIATVLAGRGEGDRARAVMWRQCMDLLAQFDRDGAADDGEIAPVVEALERMSPEVSAAQKLAALEELGPRLGSPRLVAFLMREGGAVQVAAMRRARLPDAAWPAIVAEAGPLGRAVLRQRDDIGDAARRALDAFGPNDLSLEHSGEALGQEGHGDVLELTLAARVEVSAETPSTADGSDQIRRIVDRIERFTTERQERAGRAADPATPSDSVERFAFFTDADGVIRTAYGASRAALVGLPIATAAADRSTGPDGQILGAFRRRGAFRDGRLTIGAGFLQGCWLVDGDPMFDQRTGRFTGYRGNARRASERELAPVVTPDQAEPQANASASMRQLIHELRTPLSGVMGFAELIETQLLGPVSDRYRTMAREIVSDVRGLVDILDDLDLAHRDVTQVVTRDGCQTDIAALLRAAIARFGRAPDGHARIGPEMQADLPRVAVPPVLAERMVMHFVRALAGCVGAESLAVRVRHDSDAVVTEIDRPLAMAGLSEAQLFDSGFEHVAVNMDAPVLGTGFALRLVRRLAQANGGALTVEPDRFVLRLPVVAVSEEGEQGARF